MNRQTIEPAHLMINRLDPIHFRPRYGKTAPLCSDRFRLRKGTSRTPHTVPRLGARTSAENERNAFASKPPPENDASYGEPIFTLCTVVREAHNAPGLGSYAWTLSNLRRRSHSKTMSTLPTVILPPESLMRRSTEDKIRTIETPADASREQGTRKVKPWPAEEAHLDE